MPIEGAIHLRSHSIPLRNSQNNTDIHTYYSQWYVFEMDILSVHNCNDVTICHLWKKLFMYTMANCQCKSRNKLIPMSHVSSISYSLTLTNRTTPHSNRDEGREGRRKWGERRNHPAQPGFNQRTLGPNKNKMLFPVTRPTVQITCRPYKFDQHLK